MVTIEPGSHGIEFDLESVVIRQYGKQIRKVTLETLDRLGISNAKIRMVDKGALDCTIKARVECAVFRASEYEGRVDWGGAVR
jgi:citrate lyase subunit gamma (acyl carrier protein)